MELRRAVAARRMVRSFQDRRLAPTLVTELCDQARRAPSAGNTAAVEFLVLEGDDTEAYWATTLRPEVRQRFGHPGLLRAPVLVVVVTRPDAYAERYAEPDKGRGASLGSSTDAWPVPFWWVDAGAVVQNLLLLAVDAGLGACLFGLFDHEDAVRERFGVPADRRLVGTIALGHPADDERPGRSGSRPRPPLESVLHRGAWSARGSPLGDL